MVMVVVVVSGWEEGEEGGKASSDRADCDRIVIGPDRTMRDWLHCIAGAVLEARDVQLQGTRRAIST